MPQTDPQYFVKDSKKFKKVKLIILVFSRLKETGSQLVYYVFDSTFFSMATKTSRYDLDTGPDIATSVTDWPPVSDLQFRFTDPQIWIRETYLRIRKAG